MHPLAESCQLERLMKTGDDQEAFESAVSRLPYPVFIIDGASRLRAMNADARRIWDEERLHEQQLERVPSHPFSRIIVNLLRSETLDDDETTVLQLSGKRYEVIASVRSPKGEGRWLVLMLRPFPRALSVDTGSLRTRWSLTAREAEVAAACISGRTTAEMCETLSISRETIKTHMARILDKADCKNRSQLIARFLFGD